MVVGCQAQQPPTQVIYRFDDHRYLELKGWDCEGELWYTDTLRGIHTEPVSQFY
ncbi:T6SS immunity protein Tli3 family protein, partial [Klebsiella aerogenes]